MVGKIQALAVWSLLLLIKKHWKIYMFSLINYKATKVKGERMTDKRQSLERNKNSALKIPAIFHALFKISYFLKYIRKKNFFFPINWPKKCILGTLLGEFLKQVLTKLSLVHLGYVIYTTS